MSEVEENKKLVKRFYEEVVVEGTVGLLDTLVAPDVFDHSAEQMGWAPGRAGFVQHVGWLHAAVSNVAITIDDLIGEQSRVVAFWTISGTHTGDFFGVPATGKTFTATAVSLLRFSDGQLKEYLVRPDSLSILQQLGALPVADRA